MKSLHPLMLAGTGSDVGKSIIATALCRIFRQDGYCPAPFKAQNMALNSYVTADGLEIGRAQAVQAEAAGIPCEADMNPILLKPQSDHTSQVVLLGKPIGNKNAYDYWRHEGKEELRKEVHAAFDRLSQRFNPIVMEVISIAVESLPRRMEASCYRMKKTVIASKALLSISSVAICVYLRTGVVCWKTYVVCLCWVSFPL